MFLSKRDNGYWYVWHYDQHGRKIKRSTKCRKKADALRFLSGYKLELEEQKHPARKDITFKTLFDEFMTFSAGVHTEATQKHFMTAAREFQRHMGNPRLRSIGMRDLERFLAIKQEESSRWTARRVYIALSSMMQKAVEWNYVEENPFRKVKRPTPPERRPIYFTAPELRELLGSLRDPQLKILVEAGIYTGCRLGELLSLSWDSVDLDRDEIRISNANDFVTKSKRERVLPLHPALKKVLEPLKKKARSQWVFPREETLRWSVSQMSIRFKTALKRSPLPDRRKRELHFHSLRHSHATWLLEQGVPIYSVSRILGHASVKTTEIYSHAVPNNFRSQIEMIRL